MHKHSSGAILTWKLMGHCTNIVLQPGSALTTAAFFSAVYVALLILAAVLMCSASVNCENKILYKKDITNVFYQNFIFIGKDEASHRQKVTQRKHSCWERNGEQQKLFQLT